MQKILVTGGAGYIGSHMADMLVKQGYDVIVLDDLSTGSEKLVLNAKLVKGNCGDKKFLAKLFSEHNFAAVMHFAAFIQVEESTEKPGKYYHNNVCNTLNLLDAMVEHNINNFIFSSTAAIFGEPEYTPIDEDHPKAPVNPYGTSKLMCEQILQDYAAAHGLNSISLRYFNAAGNDPEGRLGSMHEPVTHLIPLVLQAASGRRKNIAVYGSDYNTKDGTCVRDYIHVLDLCQAHLLALEQLLKTGKTAAYNLGNGAGFSVLEVIETAKQVTGKDIEVIMADRRAGDPEALVADSSKAQKELGWQPQYDLMAIVTHAWQWEQKLLQK